MNANHEAIAIMSMQQSRMGTTALWDVGKEQYEQRK